MAKRKRDVQLKVRVTPEERAMIEAKMAQLGTTNMGAYLRKMAIDGRRQAVSCPGLPPSNKGVFIPCGAVCCEVSRPCFFCGSASLQGKAASCMLKAETNKTGGILICVSF